MDNQEVIDLLKSKIDKDRTQSDIAREIGVSPQFIYHVLCGARKPSETILAYLGLEKRIVRMAEAELQQAKEKTASDEMLVDENKRYRALWVAGKRLEDFYAIKQQERLTVELQQAREDIALYKDLTEARRNEISRVTKELSEAIKHNRQLLDNDVSYRKIYHEQQEQVERLTAELQKWQSGSGHDGLKHALSNAEQLNQVLREEQRGWLVDGLIKKNIQLTSELQASKRQVERLTAALNDAEIYAQHERPCSFRDSDCDCGYQAWWDRKEEALAAVQKEKP